MAETTILITGATRGLGLETARAARARGATVLVAGRDRTAVDRTARELDARPVLLDLADLGAVQAAAAGLPHVDVVCANAGLQLVRGLTFTADGFEETFQVNHLAHLALVDALLDRPTPPRRVVLVGSATHDSAVRTGTPAPDESDDLTSMAHPSPDTEDPRTAGVRRYATTKLLAVATTAALARERSDLHVSCFDPGLMLTTGLARQYPAVVRLLASTVLRGVALLPFASTPTASGRALAALLTDDPSPVPSGSYVDHRLQVVSPSARAADVDYQDSVLGQSRALLS